MRDADPRLERSGSLFYPAAEAGTYSTGHPTIQALRGDALNLSPPSFRRGGTGYAGTAPSWQTGPWTPHFKRGASGSFYWVLRRSNPAWHGGLEELVGRNCSPRRFATEAAAKKAAGIANKQG